MKQTKKSSLEYFNEWLDSFLNFEKMPKKKYFLARNNEIFV